MTLAALLSLAIAFDPTARSAAIDRHPELKSRAVAWSAYDGSYAIDTFNRGEMLDFYWTVMMQPYPPLGWTGSVNPPVAGEISEKYRVREFSQLNAYRALNYSAPMSEDASVIADVQAGALVFAQNPGKGLTHGIDKTWVGYNDTAAYIVANSLLDGVSVDGGDWGTSDDLIYDANQPGGLVGHRQSLLLDSNVTSTFGAAVATYSGGLVDGVAVWHVQPQWDFTAPMDRFVAYPAPGYMPIHPFTSDTFRWSFGTVNANTTFEGATDSEFFHAGNGMPQLDATVTAKIDGAEVPVRNLVRNYWLTWDFDPTYLDLPHGNVAEGTKVEITVRNVAVLDDNWNITGYHDYTYTVIFFDENQVVASSFSPATPLQNLSTRGIIGSGERQLIAGFQVTGDLPVRVAVRTQGPGLARYGITDHALKTHIRVYDSAGNLLGENAGWKDDQDWRLLQSYQVNPVSDGEAGIVLTLWPGLYSAVVSDDGNANGVGMVEAFNIDNLTPSKLANLSTRGYVGADAQALISGITIKDAARTIVVRTQGPSLLKYGIQDPVSDTVLTIVDQKDGHVVATNDDWQSDPGRLATELSSYAPSDPREAALVATLPPGAYTALVSAKGSPGVGIVEVFDASPTITVEITPSANPFTVTGSPITITPTVHNLSAPISRIEFSAASTSELPRAGIQQVVTTTNLGETTGAALVLPAGLLAGLYRFTVKLTDAIGESATCTTSAYLVDTLPTVSPQWKASYPEGLRVWAAGPGDMNATYADAYAVNPNGLAVKSVEFFNYGMKVGEYRRPESYQEETDFLAPIAIMPGESYSLTALVTDDGGTSATFGPTTGIR